MFLRTLMILKCGIVGAKPDCAVTIHQGRLQTKKMSKKRASALLKKKSLAKELLHEAVKRIGDQVIEAKQDNGGKAPYGYASE